MDGSRHYHLKLNPRRDRELIDIFDRAKNKQDVVRLLYWYYDCFRYLMPVDWLDDYLLKGVDYYGKIN